VVDGTGEPEIDAQDILVISGKIKAIGATGTLSIPDGISHVDGGSKTVILGLVMVHEHLCYNEHGSALPQFMPEPISFSALYLSHGVTTMRTAGTMNITGI